MASKTERMKEKFKEMDKDGDGTLDFEELFDLLTKGNPSFKKADARKLYDGADQNHDGRIDFDEFMSYINGQTSGKERTSGGRHDRLAAGGGPVDDGTETDWSPCQVTFTKYAGKDMDNKEFAKFCKDNKLVSHGMKSHDIDLIFTKVVPKGQRRMDFKMFQDACRLMAQKRGQPTSEVQVIVAGAQDGPHLHGTKQDAVRFYDDKTTFTGAAGHNSAFEGVNPDAQLGRHERQHAAAEADRASAGEEDDWGKIEAVFNAFAGPGGEIDGREWKKFCDDVHLYNRGFAKTDVDLVFSSVARKEKKVRFAQFQDMVRGVAKKRGEATHIVQDKIASSSGPVKHATKTDAVRFHDDKSTYTGAHAEGDHPGDDRHEKMAADRAAADADASNEGPWEDVITAFVKFAGTDGIDSREFAKLCLDCDLLSKSLTKQDVDIVFMNTVEKGKRKIDEDSFVVAVRAVARKKGCSTAEVQSAISKSEGPSLTGVTKAEYSKFHDDESTYTGAHAK
jgi:hypothetical protein